MSNRTVFLITGECGVGKSTLCGTASKTGKIPRPSGAPQITKYPCVAFDHWKKVPVDLLPLYNPGPSGDSTHYAADKVVELCRANPVTVVDCPPKGFSAVVKKLQAEGVDLRIIVLIEPEDVYVSRLNGRKARAGKDPLTEERKARLLHKQKLMRGKTQRAGWMVATQDEIHQLIESF